MDERELFDSESFKSTAILLETIFLGLKHNEEKLGIFWGHRRCYSTHIYIVIRVNKHRYMSP